MNFWDVHCFYWMKPKNCWCMLEAVLDLNGINLILPLQVAADFWGRICCLQRQRWWSCWKVALYKEVNKRKSKKGSLVLASTTRCLAFYVDYYYYYYYYYYCVSLPSHHLQTCVPSTGLPREYYKPGRIFVQIARGRCRSPSCSSNTFCSAFGCDVVRFFVSCSKPRERDGHDKRV